MSRAMLLTIALLAGSALARPAAQDRSIRDATPERRLRVSAFEPIAGVRELSDQLIVRPHSLRALRDRGVELNAALEQGARARQELLRHTVVRHIPATDESILRAVDGVQAEGAVQRLAADLMGTGLFEYAEPDWILFPLSAAPPAQIGQTPAPPSTPATPLPATVCPDDPMLTGQWHHRADRLASCEAWTVTTGASDISVGVCDTGLLTSHEDLQLHRLEGYNAVDRMWESQGGDITPVHYHGTRTTGVVAANGNNGVGVTGVGWNLSHRMVRVTNASNGGAQLSNILHGARTSIESGDRIASVSYHGASIPSIGPTATYIKALGGLLVWGAGNTSSNLSVTDRDADDLIVVGATDSSDNLASFSSFGRFVDLVAPGVQILTTDRGHSADYAIADGTSYSCPMTAGMCAMLWQAHPGLSPNDVERILKASAVDLGAAGVDDQFGYGRIRLRDALRFPVAAIPVAEFGAVPTSGSTPLPVHFIDLSTGAPETWSWDFGDGTTSSEANPTHVYTASGAYSVTLTVANALGQDQSFVMDYILADIIPPVAEFDATPVAGLSPMIVDFTDVSGGGPPVTWLWDFGDGTTSTLVDPTHTYTASGIYTVSLTVSNAYGSDQRVRQDLVAVDFIPPAADFTAAPTSGASPIVVNFTDQSGAGTPTAWLWSFGDGTSSTAQNPSHTYTAQGDYSVRLRVTNAWGEDTLWRVDYIAVGAGPPLLPNFVGTPTSGSTPLTVTFTDLSIGNITGWEWNFGDGGTSFVQHPVHVYQSSGAYDVSLQVSNASGADEQLELQNYVVVQ